ncbi:bifunctional 4-hydroxy-2-oxoglutarate aldolase/2-dehydro-3-deoxy-phosphogluconate aldolase [Nesterenkonia alba]|uniref:bifunctional 4-hydroxy-2-oxoglutarate aldolase/2-dehydro-3-deoxy-phosphogluconate aldolase n=1 Tax=Nesterenkonia alba TaxID=515814 RepID=UPI0003B414C8|nr:bifunctional 4-hydroxy-2-oxoglutarate aldolase/2-dehydro-3-deoxy-phosphogluconate aldolase [Nesterenkonia alba]
MTQQSFIDRLGDHRLLGIIRGSDPEASIASALALAEAGVRFFEISLTSAGALQVLREVTRQAGREVEIGAGTVLTAAEVDAALEHGAGYIVTPALAPSVPYAVSAQVPVLAGALTPTEVLSAVEQGADAVKIFPAGRFGPGYLKDLRGPFPEVPLIPVGGVGAEDVPGYLAHGALAVGVASPLCGDAPDGGSLEGLQARAAEFLRAVAR